MIEMTDLHKSFGDVPVLRSITLKVNECEAVCLSPASGSGKSTLLRRINAFEAYDSGEIKLLHQVVC